MAAGDTDVKVCNKALLLLGAEAITSFSDGSPAAQACDTIYKEVKNSTLGMYRWSFTIAKTQLAQDTATPNSEWRYQYRLPNDILNGVPEAVRTTGVAGAAIFKDWEMNQAAGYPVLMTNATEIHIDYQRAVTEAVMPTYFITLLAYQMAWHLAEVITDQITKADYWRNIALGTINEGFRGVTFARLHQTVEGRHHP